MDFVRKYHVWVLAACCAVLMLLWLPGLQYPVVSDTSLYAELGENLWRYGQYAAQGAPFTRHPPLHAFVSYPFVALAGIHVGMKLATLFGGFAVLFFSYWLLRRSFNPGVAIISVVLLTFHHAFVLMTQLGSADLLFGALFIGSLAAYAEAGEKKKHYLLAGSLAGLACITRYNGVPLIALFLFFTLWKRRRDLFRWEFIVGIALSVLPIALWFLRNFLVFGNAFHSDFTSELERNSQGTLIQLLSNAVFYLNPLHNILPILFVTSLYGLYRHGRQQTFLVCGMFAAWILTAIWWVQAMRFAFPGYPILLGFGVVGLIDLLKSRRSFITFSLITGAVIVSHLSFLCFYAFGQCNAAVDRWKLPGVPANLHLTSEGFYAWSRMRDELDRIAPEGASVYVDTTNASTWDHGVFRSDLRVVTETFSEHCPLYYITQNPRGEDLIIAKTWEEPITYLTIIACPTR